MSCPLDFSVRGPLAATSGAQQSRGIDHRSAPRPSRRQLAFLLLSFVLRAAAAAAAAIVIVCWLVGRAKSARLTRRIDFSLELIAPQCDSGAGVDAFFHAIYTTKDSAIASPAANRRKANKRAGRPFIMLLGPHCSHVTESVAGVTSYWNIVQVRGASRRVGSHRVASKPDAAASLDFHFVSPPPGRPGVGRHLREN